MSGLFATITFIAVCHLVWRTFEESEDPPPPKPRPYIPREYPPIKKPEPPMIVKQYDKVIEVVRKEEK